VAKVDTEVRVASNDYTWDYSLYYNFDKNVLLIQEG